MGTTRLADLRSRVCVCVYILLVLHLLVIITFLISMFACFRCAEREAEEQPHFSTFALMAKKVKPGQEKLILVPFFGPFSGQHLTFSVVRNDRKPMLRVTVKSGENPISTFYHRSGRSIEGASPSFVDRCIKFAHDSAAQKITSKISAQPQRLKFLCKRAVILFSDSLPIYKLPRQVAQQFKGATEPVHFRVWRQNSAGPSLVKLYVKPHISLVEIQWMLRHRDGYDTWPSDPTKVSFYDHTQPDQCLSLDSTPPFSRPMDCVVASTSFESTPSVIVSLMGSGGLEEVPVHPGMTLQQFDVAVRIKFGLSPESFLYIPHVMKERHLKMYATVDSCTAALVGSSRTFPVVNGAPTPHLADLCAHLDVYRRSVLELGLLHTSSVLVIYEITGPTVTMRFRTVKGQENLASTGRDSVFALVEEQTHVLSINSSWQRDTLLKFIECISGLPCDCV